MNIIPRIIFTFLWLADTFVTTLFVTVGGTELEANPLLRSFMESVGIIPFILLKLVVMESALYAFSKGTQHKWTLYALWAINAIMAYVVAIGVATLFIL